MVARLQMGVNAYREIRAAEIAKKLGVTPGYLSSLEHGRKLPTLELLAKIIRVYPPGWASVFRAQLNLEDKT